MKINWPRGRYNNGRIDGFKLSLHVHLLWWRWLPTCGWGFGMPYFIWLCFSIRGEASYARD